MKGTGRLVASITVVLVLVTGALVGFVTSVHPLLGLDLVGGVSVVLSGPQGTSTDVMQKALDRIRDRVDALGVAEPDISLVGNKIQVQLPGLGGQGRVERQGNQWCAISSTDRRIGCFERRADAQARAKAVSVARVLQIIGTTARLEQREVIVPPGAPAGTLADAVQPGTPLYNKLQLTRGDPQTGTFITYDDSNQDGRFTPGTDPKYALGPVLMTGAGLTKATAQFLSASNTQSAQTGWQVVFNLNKEGAKQFGTITSSRVNKLLAIVLDRVVQSAPKIVQPITNGQGTITGSFTEAQAKDLALVLNSGSLPVELTRETATTVSPTLGKESLHQGILAGVVGLILLMLYLAFYYRLLGIVTWFGMAIWAVLALGLVSLLGRSIGYALTLAGVAGIIVSLGITADSYIVFYERLKDEVRHGKTLRSAVVPAFNRSWRTIVAADIVTIIAAATLYVLAIGSVKGFALTLGLSTALDMFVVFFFKRPVVFLLSRSPVLSNLPGMGLRSGVAADPVPVVAGGER